MVSNCYCDALLPSQGKCVTWDVTVSDTLAQSYVHETSQTPGAAAEAAAERKRNKYSLLNVQPVVLGCSSRGRNDGGHQQGRDGSFERTWKAHHTKHRCPPQDRIPLSATIRFNSTLQCGRCLGYLHPHNPKDEM